jgi:peptide-methionine (S)-S-oxide reductase
MRFFNSKPDTIPSPADALAGRPDPIVVPGSHTILGTPLAGPWPVGTKTGIFGLGCFWGAEKAFWQLPGVVTTAVGYAGGSTPNPTYNEACTGKTGHAEAVLVAYDPARISYEQLLKTFWEDHDPTQQMRQGNDVGTQYRSIILTADDEQRAAAEASRDVYQAKLSTAGFGTIATEIAPAGPFYYAEDYHQQYLDKNPYGYNCDNSTGVACPIGGLPVSAGTTSADVESGAPIRLLD